MERDASRPAAPARETQFVQEMTISMQTPADPSATIAVPMKQNITVKLTNIEYVK